MSAQKGDRPHAKGGGEGVGSGVVAHLCPVREVSERGGGHRKRGVIMESGGAKRGPSPAPKVDERVWSVGPPLPCVPCKRGSSPVLKVEEREWGWVVVRLCPVRKMSERGWSPQKGGHPRAEGGKERVEGGVVVPRSKRR